MLRTLVPGSLLAVIVGAALAQPLAWGNISYNSRVSQAANQLFQHVEHLKVFASTFRHPQVAALQQLVNAYYEDVLGFSRFMQRDPQ